MSRKKIIILLCVITGVGVAFWLYYQSYASDYVPSDDEIALHVQFDLEEDVGLLVFDYEVDDHTYSGGMSNADGSLLQKKSDNVQVFKKQDLNCNDDTFDFTIQFRIITEYVTPNFENIYDEDITKYLEPISWQAEFGQSYYMTITGNKSKGYKVSFEHETS